jgi:hypothetical protein
MSPAPSFRQQPFELRQLEGIAVEAEELLAAQRESRGDMHNVVSAEAVLGGMSKRKLVKMSFDVPQSFRYSHEKMPGIQIFIKICLGGSGSFGTRAREGAMVALKDHPLKRISNFESKQVRDWQGPCLPDVFAIQQSLGVVFLKLQVKPHKDVCIGIGDHSSPAMILLTRSFSEAGTGVEPSSRSLCRRALNKAVNSTGVGTFGFVFNSKVSPSCVRRSTLPKRCTASMTFAACKARSWIVKVAVWVLMVPKVALPSSNCQRSN